MMNIHKKMRNLAKKSDKIILLLCACGLFVELFCQEWEPAWCASPCRIFEMTLGIIGLLYCIYYTVIFLNPIKRDWLLAKGRFLSKVVNFVLLVPFVLTLFIHIVKQEYSPKNIVFEKMLYPKEEQESKEEIEEQSSPTLFWSVYYHFIDPGNQHMTSSASGRKTAAAVAILGYLLLNGLLISMVINWFDRRRELWLKGEIRYNRFFKRKNRKHYVIIGGNDVVQSIVKQLFKDNGTPYIVILTSCEIEGFRRELFAALNEIQQQHIIIYYGKRTSQQEIENLHIEKAREAYIIGEDTRTDDIESYHDTMNMECLKLLCSSLKQASQSTKRKEKLVCRVMFEYQTTFSVFQFFDINKEVGNIIDFRPFNYYEIWAQKVLINKEISPKNIETTFKDGGFMPLEGADGIKEHEDSYVHLFVVGMSRIGVAMAIEAAHLCHYPNYENKKIRTRITFIDKNAAEEKNFFIGRFKDLFALSHWRYGSIDERGALEWKAQDKHIPVGFDYLGGDFLDIEWEFINGGIETAAVQDYILKSANPPAKVTIAICLPESNRSHAAALYLDKRIYESDSVLQVLTYNRYGNSIVRAISDSGTVHPYCGKLRHYGYSGIDFLKDLEESEDIGRKINEAYCNMTVKTQYNPEESNYKGKSAVANLWSSIYNGNTLWTKLRCIDLSPKTFVNDEKTINLLARVEHNRWNIEELLMNFRPLTFEEQKNEIALKNRNKNILKGQMAHTDICSNKRLDEIDCDSRKYDIELTKCLLDIYNDETPQRNKQQ
ncbi:MAG: hypothetical protein IKV07_03680 [Bacteroidaceae bacterium]|nr:hypothetical protein [Bacteroidaceae bacterium]